MQTVESKRPAGRQLNESLYSNFDHELNTKVEAELERDCENYAQHGAWNYCGYVWTDGLGMWFEEVWQWKAPVEVIEAASAQGVIEKVLQKYGDE